MKLREITFEEHHLDEKPEGNYWRGIMVKLGGITMLQIELYEGNLCITLGAGVIPHHLYQSFHVNIPMGDYEETEPGKYDDPTYGGMTFKMEDKDRAKARAVEIINKYFAVFTE